MAVANGRRADIQGLARDSIIKIPLSRRFRYRGGNAWPHAFSVVMNFHGVVIMEFLRGSIVETNRANNLSLMGIMEIASKVEAFPLTLCWF